MLISKQKRNVDIIYADHLKLRIKLRDIPYNLPKRVFLVAKERYFDFETQKYVAVQRVKYRGKMRELMVAYVEDYDGISLITIHPLKENQKSARIKSGRWQKI